MDTRHRIWFAAIAALAGLALAACEERHPPVAQQSGEQLEEVTVTGSRVVVSEPPFWNAWFEPGRTSRPSYRPLPVLEAGSSYSLFIDLSGLRFDAEGVTTEPASRPLRKNLAESTDDTLELRLLVVTDRRRIRLALGESPSRILSVNMNRFRSLAAGTAVPASDDDPLYSLGSVSFRLDTREHPGTATVGVSIWANGVPVDQLLVPACVGKAEACDHDVVAAHSLYGLDSARIGLQLGERARPDGAIHYVDLWDAGVMGVFRCNTCGWEEDEFATWMLNYDADQLQHYLSNTIQPAFERAAKFKDSDSFRATGRDLYRLLMGRDREAMAVFEAFFARAMQGPGIPSLFVRLIEDPYGPPLLVPLGLMSVPVADEQHFVGEVFRVEAPLLYQDYSAQSSCLDRWTLLVPRREETGALGAARQKIAGRIGAFRRANAEVHETIADFRKWLETDSFPPAEEDAVGVIILSHHEDNRLYFDENRRTPNIASTAILRQFRSPSLVIINACGAASPGAADFVGSFNLNGVPTIIASSTTVDAAMAGDFMNLLAAQLIGHQDDPAFNIGLAVYEAVQELKETHGEYALVYGIYGNGNLRACFPR